MIEWRRRDEKKLVGWMLAFMAATLLMLILFPAPLYAGGLNASFTGSRFSGMTRHSTVTEYWGVVDESNNLIDMSGENLLTDRTEFDDWDLGGTCAVTADQWRNPVDGTLDADYLDNTGDNNGRRYQICANCCATGTTFTFSTWIRSDYIHTVTIGIYDAAAVAWTTRDYVVDTVWRR